MGCEALFLIAMMLHATRLTPLCTHTTAALGGPCHFKIYVAWNLKNYVAYVPASSLGLL